MELGEYPFSEGLFDSFEVYLSESAEGTVFPVAICQESVKVRMIVERLACRLHRKDSCEFTLVDSEYLRQSAPCSAKEDGIEFAVVLKEGPQAFGDGEDGVADFGELSRAVGDVLDDFVVDMLPTSPRLRRTSCELHRSLSSTRRAHPPTFAWFDRLTTEENAIRSECLQPSQYTRAAP